MKKDGQLDELLTSEMPYSQGLVHFIYRHGNYIYKVTKNDFPDFNNKEHFLIEKKSLKLMSTLGIPIPSEIVVGVKNINRKKIFYLHESFIKGIQYQWENLSSKALTNLKDIYINVHQAKLNKFGPLNSKLEGSFSNWHDYISNIVENSNFLNIKNKKKIHDIVKQFSSYLNEINTAQLVLVDFNPGNIFFNETDDIVGVIDIDHPIGGDPLYDFASIKWYSPKTYEKLKNNIIKFNPSDEKIIDFYCLIQGINVIDWMKEHNLANLNEITQLSIQQDLVEKIL